MSANKILINGKTATHISAMDRGLHYGDGLFETISVIRGEIPLWNYHINRLKRSCARLLLPIPDESQLLNEINQLCAGHDYIVIKVIITRGTSERGYQRPAHTETSRIVCAFQRPELPRSYWDAGVKVSICNTHLARQPLLAGIKHLNRLEQILASNEYSAKDYQEGLVGDYNNNVIEATSHNIFMVMSGEILTPNLSDCGVEGIMREYVLNLAQKENIPIKITSISFTDLKAMDEVFLTNSVHGIWPVKRINTQDYPVGALTRSFRDQVARILPYK